jgi:AraC family transcriptional activator of pobA
MDKQAGTLSNCVTNFGPHAIPAVFDLARLEDRMDVSLQLPHRHEAYQIVWVRCGTGSYVIDSEIYPIGNNAIFILSPGRVRSLKLHQGSRGYLLSFSTDLLHSMLAMNGSAPWFSMLDDWVACPALYVNPDRSTLLLDTITRLEWENSGNELSRIDALRAYVQIILIQLHRCHPYPRNHCGSIRSLRLVERFRLLVEDHFTSRFPIREYASLLHVTEGHLNDITKRVTGKTASQFVHDRTLFEAKRLLIHENRCIADVAYRLSFKDPAYFGRFFKKNTHLSPSEFIQMFENKHRSCDEHR